MFKLIVGLLAIGILPKLCDTAVAIYPKEDKPPEFACQEGCYLKKLNRVIGYGETYYNVGKECASYECRDSGETVQYTCGVIAAGPDCQVVKGDLNLKYPDCCSSVKCSNRKTKGPINTLPTVPPSKM
ncbi:uncharacterized protein LOC113239706 [Hyposmocoma kahamanoa]|uniref:uncharacterized protein LOC113239706 n=1 Tax=Hyposmocoma kahamanoa TaxID=1477025 RepID=UPI000E6D717E|nr:uncharacterized protein LOC113239706 [Hyposmocoma kahamanoa]